MRTGPILALDIATNTGVAYGDPANGLPHLSTVRFGGQGASLEEAFGEAVKWIEAKLAAEWPGLIAFESPVPPSFMRGHTNVNTIRKLMGLAAVIGGTAHSLGFYNLAEASVRDIRQHFLGVTGMRGAEAKKAAIARCKALGLNPRDDNQADACALWCFAAGLHAAQPELISCPRARKPKKLKRLHRAV